MYNLLHVSETYNITMSLHALGISVDVHIRQLSVKKSCYIIFRNTFEKKKAKIDIQKCICKNSEYLSVHGVMIDLFSPGNIYYFINFVWTSLFYKIKCFFFL